MINEEAENEDSNSKKTLEKINSAGQEADENGLFSFEKGKH
jgi:hypothetical protein